MNLGLQLELYLLFAPFKHTRHYEKRKKNIKREQATALFIEFNITSCIVLQNVDEIHRDGVEIVKYQE